MRLARIDGDDKMDISESVNDAVMGCICTVWFAEVIAAPPFVTPVLIIGFQLPVGGS